MDFLALSLRMAATGVADCLPYGFEGTWTDEDKAVVVAAIAPHVPERVDSLFNNWLFWGWTGSFAARRATWDMGGLHANTAVELAKQIEDYYGRR